MITAAGDRFVTFVSFKFIYDCIIQLLYQILHNHLNANDWLCSTLLDSSTLYFKHTCFIGALKTNERNLLVCFEWNPHTFPSSVSDKFHPSRRGPEGGRSGTADDAPAGKKLQAGRQLQHHRAFPLRSSNDERRFTCPQHQTHVAFSKTNDMVSSLCQAHLLTLTPVLVFFPLCIYMESVVCLCSVLWGVSGPLSQIDIKQGQRGTWWLEHDWEGYFLSSDIATGLGSWFFWWKMSL